MPAISASDLVKRKADLVKSFYYNNIELSDPLNKLVNRPKKKGLASDNTTARQGAAEVNLAVTVQAALALTDPAYAIVKNPDVFPNPDPVSNVTVVSTGNLKATLSWTRGIYNGKGAFKGYKIVASPGGKTFTTTSTSASITGLDNGTTYTFKVSALSDQGESTPVTSSSALVNPATTYSTFLTGAGNNPMAIAVDATNTYVYYAARNAVSVWRASVATKNVVTWGGAGPYQGGGPGLDGPLATSSLYSPESIGIDSIGNIYVSDGYDGRVRKVDASTNALSSIAGNAPSLTCYTQDGTGITQNGADSGAGFCYPHGLVMYSDDIIYIVESTRIRKLVISTQVVTTLAGGTSSGYVNDVGTAARFSGIFRIAADRVNGILYVNENANGVVRKIVISTGVVTTYLSFDVSCLTCDAAGNLYLTKTSGGIYVYNSSGVGTLLQGGVTLAEMTITPDGSTLYGILNTNSTIYRLDIA